MKHFVLVENGIVTNISVADENWHKEGWYQSDTAQIGWTYVDGVFIAPQPYPSWVLIENEWIAPVERPTNGKFYSWNEDDQTWIERKMN